MSYEKSIARQDFEDTVKTFHSLSKDVSLKKRGISHEIQQCVYRNAIFQTSAALEEFIKSILEDWIHLLHKHKKKSSCAPKELIFWAVGKDQKSAFQQFVLTGDEGKFIAQLSGIKRLPTFFDEATEIKDIINIYEHIRDRKYPSKKNIIALFRRFGVNNLFKEVQIKGKKDYIKILESFSDVRTEIAHQHPTPDLTFNDIKQQLHSICDFVAKIDRVLYSHIIKTSGQDCWKTQMI